ncbi:MAG: hypothetical protein ACLQU4_19685 [Limisphaerales bacterium]
MTESEIKKHIIALHRNDIWTLARLKAFESVVAESVPKKKFKAWEDKIEVVMNRQLQVLLEDVENKFPGWAAEVDNRGPSDLRGVE